MVLKSGAAGMLTRRLAGLVLTALSVVVAAAPAVESRLTSGGTADHELLADSYSENRNNNDDSNGT